MTQWNDIKEDPNARQCLNLGFVVLTDIMGDDKTIVQSARVSYGVGTKKVSEDRGLIRYLIRHLHTTPIEMIEFRFLCKMPIFVARQWIRHRTANVNEYSGRYSVMVDEFYVPELEHILPQSKINNQGRGGEMSMEDKIIVREQIVESNFECYNRYQDLLGEKSGDLFTGDFEGISREMARGVLSVNNYTEWFWKIDLHNLFHFLALRMDSHAQYEIRVFADAMYELIKPVVPLATEAFEDFILNAERMSRMEMDLLRYMVEGSWDLAKSAFGEGTEKGVAKHFGLSMRELREFKEKLGLDE